MTKIDSMLFIDEGYREKPYNDSRGFPTVGIGQLLGPKGTPLSAYSFTVPIDVAKLWCKSHCTGIAARLAQSAEFKAVWLSLGEARQDALINMAYQLGYDGLMKFRKLIAAVSASDWKTAFNEGLDSSWYKQTPARAVRVLTTLQTGTYRAYEGLQGWSA